MIKKITLLYFSLIALSCKKTINCNLSNEILNFNDSIIQKSQSEKWLSHPLTKINDTELTKTREEAYRFTILGAWGSISSYKIVKNSDRVSITKKEYWKYYDDREIDSLGKEKTKKLNMNDWNNLESYLNNINFWTLPVIKKDDYRVLDGTSYLIEGYTLLKNECSHKNYDITNRVSPPMEEEYRLLFSKIEKLISE